MDLGGIAGAGFGQSRGLNDIKHSSLSDRDGNEHHPSTGSSDVRDHSATVGLGVGMCGDMRGRERESKGHKGRLVRPPRPRTFPLPRLPAVGGAEESDGHGGNTSYSGGWRESELERERERERDKGRERE